MTRSSTAKAGVKPSPAKPKMIATNIEMRFLTGDTVYLVFITNSTKYFRGDRLPRLGNLEVRAG